MAELRTELLVELRVDLEEPQEVGATPHGNRRIFYIKGGTFAGPKLKGEVLPGGGDWLVVRPDDTWKLDVRETLRTDDGQLIYMTALGIFHVATETIQRFARDHRVDSSEYYFRTTPAFETGSEKYGWLNRTVAVGTCERTPTGLIHTVYAIL